jgi:ABC-type polysaccharide/polyol phosphate export permease
MLLTPVLYERPPPRGDWASRLLSTVTEYNPLYYLIEAPRDLVLQGRIFEWRGFLISAALSVAVFVLSLLGFHLTETRIAERV